MQPLIVSLALDEQHQRRFDDERRRLFPAGRTVIGAHVTLFHALPGMHLDAVRNDLHDAADRPDFDVLVTGLMSLGSGVAYRLESTDLAAVHGRMQRAWSPWLTRQDAQGFRPHVTVQNKVGGDVAQATLEQLRAAFMPTTATATALRLWRYAAGPWEPIASYPFAAG